ncbi:Aminomethyltransferase folate-binding domain-containing protein [Hypomontagnella submonticulosa]|nr:Aminomethyltransferase folate-binding domain-containing protein [Hypomontagnella submonticulosa]
MPILPRARALPGLALPLRPASFVCASCQSSQRSQRRQFSGTIPSRTGASSHAPPSAPPPSSGFARLTSRRLISISGPDAAKFLHGIITQNLVSAVSTGGGEQTKQTRIDAPPPPRTANAAKLLGFYAGFLNAAGRVLHDVFVYRDLLALRGEAAAARGGDAFLVEVDADQVDALAKHIKRYKLRSNLTCRVLDDGECGTWQVWEDPQSSGPSTLSSSDEQHLWLSRLKNSIVEPDTRAPGMGYRVLQRGDGVLNIDLERSNEEAYRVRRYLLGVAEGQPEILRGQALPLESNMDVMRGIDFRKGCYVGQELTIRTRHRGVVRKRILPCLLYPSSPSSAAASPPEQLEYKPYINEGKGDTQISAADIPSGSSIGKAGTKGRSAGTWLRGVGNIGLALCRLQIMTDVELPGETAVSAPFNPAKDEFVVKWGADEESGSNGQMVKVKAFVPDWLREGLEEEAIPIPRPKRPKWKGKIA